VSAAITGFSSSHSAANERRLVAVESLWKAMLNLRRNAPPVTVWADVMSDDEFARLHTRPDLLDNDLMSNIEGEITQLMSASANVEEHRPFCGELPWALFFIYRAIHGRLLFLIGEGFKRGVIVPWRRDHGMQQLLSSVLNSEEMSEVMRGQFGRWYSCLQLLEAKFLREVESVISGKHASDASLQEATRIVAAVQSVARNVQQQRS
jgi:hypothetical protein